MAVIVRMALQDFPTRVGMARDIAALMILVKRFPHTRGDGPARRGGARQRRLISPHAWGWPAVVALVKMA